jgi:beta-N-acetylhexosaminidase
VSTSVSRLAAACLVPSFAGPERPDWLRPWLEGGLGGICLFASNVRDPEQLAALTASLRQDAPRLLVALDEEGGDVTRLEVADGSSFPSALGLGVVDDVELTEAVAAAIAAELAAVGVNLNLAPVADVNTNPDNPVIGIRSFGSVPELVARHVAAFVRGTQRAGVAACAKHFPGHGDTRQDSHHELPVVDAPELEPFRAAVEAGVRAVMTAHVVVRSLGPEPATVSPAAMRLLREELGFDGLVVSDALDMRAVADTIGVEESAVQALAAGVDALCLGPAIGPEGVAAVRDAIVAAVESGRLPEERLAEAAARVDACGSEPQRPVPDRAIGSEAARRALLVRGDVDPGEAPRVLELLPAPSMAAGHTGASFLRELQARIPGASADGTGRVVLVVRDFERHTRLRQAATAVLDRHPDAIVVETGVPGWAPPGATAVVVTHGGGRASLAAAADALAQAAGAASSASSRSTSSGVL